MDIIHHRKAPGGVFFSLLKKTATKDQLAEIFRVEKKLHSHRKRKSLRTKRLQEEKMEGCGESDVNDMPSKATDTTKMNVFTRLSMALSQGRSNHSATTNIVSSETSVAACTHEGQSTEVEVDQTRRANVFSRLDMRKQNEGQSPTRCANEGLPWQSESKEGVCQTGSKEGVCQEESMDVDSVNPPTAKGTVQGEENGCGLRSIEDIWEREKAAALEFDDASDSGVEFSIHLSAL